MSSSEANTDFINVEPSKGAAAVYVPGDEGAGSIKAGGKDLSFGDVAHELFHGYQNINGKLKHPETGERITGAEVGAYLFEDVVTTEVGMLPSGGSLSSSGDKRGNLYQRHYTELLYGGYDQARSRLAAKWFKYSGKNNQGIYNDYRSYSHPNPPIKKFIPPKF